ncbi:hypothetical protein MDAP_000238 [Mitosporidium daphniae]|uniref:Elongation factor Ts n=1 Tax=Mitosporidium daphniae TaxID=1485682 RepID=A0A098VRZ1_9MICR|nr:elongation factor Ts [Mitosporidium daphniae]KGG51813.1 elongation factor Ts [Mitosporidium daphniae]|eukprot:XP_013238240.1 elongation factor Ts [Mitosporidium daphniae]
MLVSKLHPMRWLSVKTAPEAASAFQAKLVRLRSATSLPLLRCRQALNTAGGDENQARTSLFAELASTGTPVHIERTDSCADPRNSGGHILSGVLIGHDAATLLQLRFSSDFSSRCELSRTALCKILLSAPIKDQNLSGDFETGNMFRSLAAQLREQLSVARIEHIPLTSQSLTACYIHPPLAVPANQANGSVTLGERIVAIIEFEALEAEYPVTIMGSKEATYATMMRKICQQFAAEGPLVQGGTMDTFLNRPFLFDAAKSIRAALTEAGIRGIRRAVRFDNAPTPLCITSNH